MSAGNHPTGRKTEVKCPRIGCILLIGTKGPRMRTDHMSLSGSEDGERPRCSSERLHWEQVPVENKKTRVTGNSSVNKSY